MPEKLFEFFIRMSDLNNHSQLHAQKKNLGALQNLVKRLEQLKKQEKKSLQNIDQQALEAQKFLGEFEYKSVQNVSKR